tara:strand:+ start:21 stop:830 length:810 start_codon:yes stop_codon:yes gene_type:complete
MTTKSLTNDQLNQLYTHGYTIVQNAIPMDLVRSAKKAINRSLGQGVASEQVEKNNHSSWCSELKKEECILDLYYKSNIISILESAIGKNNLDKVKSGQIALRFPYHDEIGIRKPHIDGFHTPLNGVPKDKIMSFTCMVGVCLSNQKEDYMGNLVVYPGSHHIVAEKFKQQYDINGATYGPGYGNWNKGLLYPPGTLYSKIEPKQILAGVGDLIICHYCLLHCFAHNTSSEIRYNIYFRIRHKDHPEDGRVEARSECWLEWEELKKKLSR